MKRFNRASRAVLAAGVALLVIEGAWSPAHADDPPPAEDQPALRPNHPPIALIPPIPVPEAAARGDRPASNTLMYHDAVAGVTTRRPAPPPSGEIGGSGGGHAGHDGGGGWEPTDPTASFFDLDLISPTSGSPWRMNCKVVMRFTDQAGSTRWFTGSGAMMDAETVITAAHCVYARETDGVDIFDWADEVWVYPGWDGVGGQFNAPPSTVHNYGFGRGTVFMAGTDYVDNGDPDGDCALIRITRGVGMLTGWFGWTWGYSCSWIQDHTYHNASFPSEDCPIGGLHNGSDMYYWYGTIDSCPANQMELDTAGGCFDTVWGGMSGSGMYWIDGATRNVHAICSTSDRDTWGRYCMLWEVFVQEMNSSFVPDARGSAFDLQALDVNVEPAVVAAGSPLTLANFFATNPTNGSANGTWTYRVYLSTNDNISGSDTLLDTLDFDLNYSAMTSTRVHMALPTIPIDTPPGDYWLGVVLDSATDGNSANNDTDGWDAVPITVVDHCFATPSYDTTITPESTWQTMPAASLGPQGCRVIRMYLYTGYEYDFSLCGNDGVGGWANPGESDLRMYDAAGNLMWFVDGFMSCGYDASTIGTSRERWSPPEHGYYYLQITEHFDEEMDYTLAYKYASAEHCYSPPDHDLELNPSSTWYTTSIHSIDAPGSCRVYKFYLAKALDYDFSLCANDGVGGFAGPGDADMYMRDETGALLWYLDGVFTCDYDATTIGSVREAWSPPQNGYYYLQVREYYDEPMTFRLAFRITPGAPPENDDCEDANISQLNTGWNLVFGGVNVGATIDSDLDYPEVWHAFTTTECLDVTLSYCDTFPAFENAYAFLKDTCPAYGPNVVASGWDNVSCGNINWTFTWDDLPAGTYWYPVLWDDESEGQYFIDVSAVSCDAIPGDIDGDGDVDFQDLLALLAAWGPCSGCPADVDGDGEVDFQDLLIVLAAWGA